MAKLEDVLKALLKKRLKISPKKCQLFRTELQYVGNTKFVKDRRVCIIPIKSILEAKKKYSHLQQLRDVEVLWEWSIFYVLSGITKMIKTHI